MSKVLRWNQFGIMTDDLTAHGGPEVVLPFVATLLQTFETGSAILENSGWVHWSLLVGMAEEKRQQFLVAFTERFPGLDTRWAGTAVEVSDVVALGEHVQ